MIDDHWLECACADAERRGLPELKPLLIGIAQATRRLRTADWNGLSGAVRQTPGQDQPGTAARWDQGSER
jgi:hypothetical protein